MFYKKRIEELEERVNSLIKELEKEEATGEYYGNIGHWHRYKGDNNKWLTKKTGYNARDIHCLFEYLGVEYVTETMRLVKREKNILEQAKEHEEEVT
jgi:hypothetical protein